MMQSDNDDKSRQHPVKKDRYGAAEPASLGIEVHMDRVSRNHHDEVGATKVEPIDGEEPSRFDEDAVSAREINADLDHQRNDDDL